MRFLTFLSVAVIFSPGSFAQSRSLVITSPAFVSNGSIPVKYTCLGQDASPPLNIGNIPPGTASLALIVDDPDEQENTIVTVDPPAKRPASHKKHTRTRHKAPSTPQRKVVEKCGFTNWIMWNLDTTGFIPENFKNEDEGVNSINTIGYTGVCPSLGTHRYHFRVYALNTRLNIGKNTGKADLEKVMQGHIITKGELVGIYNKSYR